MHTLAKMVTAACLLVVVPCWGQSSEESAARAAEQAGKLREALNQYTAALQKAIEGSADEQRLREAIIGIAQKISPRPVAPDEAERYLARGRAAVKDAKSPNDLEEAASEFRKALRAAPWHAQGYFNLALVQEKAAKYDAAIRNFKLYLLAAPNAPDAVQVKSQIYEIEYRQEKAQKEAATRRDAEEAKRKTEEDQRRRLEGFWATGADPANSSNYRLSLSRNEVQIYLTGYCVQGRCTTANVLTFRGLLRVDGGMTGSVFIESVTVGNRGAYCEFTGGEFPATAQISPNYDQIEFSVTGQRQLTGLCSRAGTSMPAGHNAIRKQ